MDKIFDNYYEKIYYWALSKTKCIEDAEDLTNDVFLAVFTYFNKNIKIEKLENLVWKIAHNLWNRKAINYIQEKKIKEIEDYMTSYQENMMDKIIYKDIVENIENYHLTEKELQCFKYYYYQDLSIKEITEKIQSTESNVKYYLYSARNKIREKYYD